MKLLICGDRNWNNIGVIRKVILETRPDLIIEGEAKGADTLGRLTAEELNIPVLRFPANWSKYGKAAGPIRNQQMLNEGKPDLVVGFHNDIQKSRGTKDMLMRARKSGIRAILIVE